MKQQLDLNGTLLITNHGRVDLQWLLTLFTKLDAILNLFQRKGVWVMLHHHHHHMLRTLLFLVRKHTGSCVEFRRSLASKVLLCTSSDTVKSLMSAGGADYHDFPKEEEKILELWERLDAFQSCLRQSKDKPRFALNTKVVVVIFLVLTVGIELIYHRNSPTLQDLSLVLKLSLPVTVTIEQGWLPRQTETSGPEVKFPGSWNKRERKM